MSRQDRAHPNARNFGLGSKDMDRAGLHALREGMQSCGSINTMSDRWHHFARFARQEWNIRDMRKLNREHVQHYADYLRERFDRGELAPATAQNYLSAVNRVLEIARGDKHCHVNPVRDAGLPTRTGICQASQAPGPELRATVQKQVSHRLSVQIDLQRALGLRFEEAAKINATRLLAQAEQQQSIRVSDGTKGGHPRQVPITNSYQIIALREAAKLQGRNPSLIPANMTYKTWRNQSYEVLRRLEISGFHFHGNRHEYAHARYQSITGCACPVVSGVPYGKAYFSYMSRQLNVSPARARQRDLEARLQIARELGHYRIRITRAYLG